MIHNTSFAWDPIKELNNIRKHGVDFVDAAKAFKDANRVIFMDSLHSNSETRLFCVGLIEGRVLTVRFTYRDEKIRIFGAGY